MRFTSLLFCLFALLFGCQLRESANVEDPNAPLENTLSIIKPDAVASNHVGAIIDRLEAGGLRVAAVKMEQLSRQQAQEFYSIHRERPFFSDLINFMTSGPVVIMVLHGRDAIAKNRQIMGATDPTKAQRGTIRADFATSMTENAVHGSDAPETAKQEIAFFFTPSEIFAPKL